MLKFKDFVHKILNEETKVNKETNSVINYIKDLFIKQKYSGDRKSKHGSHLRFQLDQDNRKALKIIEDILKKSKIIDYTISEPKIGDYGNGAKSGEFQTFAIEFNQDIKRPGLLIHKNTVIYVVNSVPQKGIFSGKALSPSSLKISTDTNLTLEDLYNEVDKNLEIKFKNQPASQLALRSLVDDVYNWTPGKIFNSPYDIKPFNSSIPYSTNTGKYLEALSSTDINAIGKDFGEILGGLFLLKCVNTKLGVKFPKGNEPLIDFFIDDNIKISSKYKKGAAPTLSGILANVDIETLNNPIQKKLYEVLEISSKTGVSDGYLKIAKHMNLPGYQVLCKIMKNSDPSINQIEDFVKSVAINSNGTYDSEKFFDTFNEFYQTIDSWPKNKTIDWEKLRLDKKYYGVIIGPLSINVAKSLNADPIYVEALKSLCSMVPINQLYLDFNLKTNLIEFHLKTFEAVEAKFKFEAPNQSVYNPSNGRLGFSLQ